MLIDKKNVSKLRLIFSVILVIIVLFSIRVMVRNNNWYSEESLYTYDIKNNSESYQLESGMGRVDNFKKDIKGAEVHYIHSTELFPSYITYSNLASYYLQNNKSKKAVAEYIKAHNYKNTNPISWAYLGIAKYKSGDKNGAINDVKKAYSILPNNDFLVILETIEKNEQINIQKE